MAVQAPDKVLVSEKDQETARAYHQIEEVEVLEAHPEAPPIVV